MCQVGHLPENAECFYSHALCYNFYPQFYYHMWITPPETVPEFGEYGGQDHPLPNRLVYKSDIHPEYVHS